MPIIKSAIKRMRQTAKRYARNLTTKRNMRSAVKTFMADKALTNLSKAQSELDKAVKKNLISKNTAARKKARLAKAAKAAGTTEVAKPKKATTKKATASKAKA